MSKKDYTIGLGAFGTVYLGKLNKDGTQWIGDKKDITSEFLGCVIHKFGPNGHSDISNEKGEVTHRVIVVEANRKVAINDKVIFDPKIETFDVKIRDVGFSTRTLNCLKSTDIETLGQLIEYAPHELLYIRQFGSQCLDEVIEVLASKGLELNG